MIILLPPSEGKTPASTGPALNLEDLAFPELTAARLEVLEALQQTSAAPDSLQILGVGPTLSGEVARNLELTRIPCAPALQTYTGVLFAALDAPTLTTTAQHRLGSLYVSSGLFGIVAAGDLIPAYRLAMKVRLPETGVLSTWWKKRLAPVLDARFADELVVDCRSGDYRKSWPGDPAHTVVVNVYTERAGKRSVVSHNAKHTRGLLARHLLERTGSDPDSPQELAGAAGEAFTVELTAAGPRKPAELAIILTA
ncbi:YaaA family protein [Brevibacterium moorei]|uniref:YaaA family protein n=1 Tax=Brevibacterium moorei TaxID=2968457 RepID=UPI00211D0FF7|nr:peroxide stress protein YaaA [Brevibacterium sp. 68QC2CO]